MEDLEAGLDDDADGSLAGLDVAGSHLAAPVASCPPESTAGDVEDICLQLAEGEGECMVCDKTFEDIHSRAEVFLTISR